MKEVIIIGGGFSIKEGIEKGLWDKIKGKEVWSLNYAYKFLPYLPTRQLWMDTTFFKNNVKDLQALAEKNVPLYTKVHPMYKEDMYKDKIKTYEVTRDWTKRNDITLFVGQLGLVGTFALSLACEEKYDTIYLLGYDFGAKNNTDLNTHFYVDDAKGIQSSGLKNPNVYYENTSIKASVLNYNDYNSYTSKILNVSLQSNISAFQRIGYDEFFTHLKDIA
jgi:hypothetical protein